MTDTALARTTDPDTSHYAAASIGDLQPRHTAVLEVFRTMQTHPKFPALHAGLTHPQLIEWYRFAADLYPDRFPPQSDSSIRSRAAELVKKALVVDTGVRVTVPPGRRRFAVWSIADLPVSSWST